MCFVNGFRLFEVGGPIVSDHHLPCWLQTGSCFLEWFTVWQNKFMFVFMCLCYAQYSIRKTHVF